MATQIDALEQRLYADEPEPRDWSLAPLKPA
jgi:hypothetical protein